MVGTFRKSYVTSFFIAGLIATTMFAGSDEELFLQANKSYRQKDYHSAFRSYDMMSKKGRAALYNMGNCCFQQGDYARALVYWSRAEVGATAKEYAIISHNKEHVRHLIGKEVDQSFFYRIMNIVSSALPNASLFFLQLFFLLCWGLLVFSACKRHIKAKKIVLSCLSLLIVISGVSLRVHYIKQNSQDGIVVKKEAQLLVGPDKGFHAVAPLMYANTVKVKEMRDGWYKIRYDDMIGWVEADAVQII